MVLTVEILYTTVVSVLVCCVAKFADSVDGVHLMTLTYLFTCVKYI